MSIRIIFLKAILRGEKDEINEMYSDDLRNMINSLLCSNIEHRLQIQEVIKHPRVKQAWHEWKLSQKKAVSPIIKSPLSPATRRNMQIISMKRQSMRKMKRNSMRDFSSFKSGTSGGETVHDSRSTNSNKSTRSGSDLFFNTEEETGKILQILSELEMMAENSTPTSKRRMISKLEKAI